MENSHQFIDHILRGLFAAEERRRNREIAELNKANEEAHQGRFDGFSYGGRVYRLAGLKGQLSLKVLHHTLYERMDAFLADHQEVANDRQEISQVLFRLISPCMTLQELRDAVPNCLTQFLPDNAKQLERRFAEVFTLTGNPRLTKQYQKALPKMELYSSAHLLY